MTLCVWAHAGIRVLALERELGVASSYMWEDESVFFFLCIFLCVNNIDKTLAEEMEGLFQEGTNKKLSRA